MRLTLYCWRQKNADTPGQFAKYDAPDVTPDMSFLEMLDVVNWSLIENGEEPIAFDSDCREGICGSCSMMINGVAHGPMKSTATCQLHMRHFKDGDTVYIEPWRSRAFPLIRDLVVDRSAFDRIIEAGGFISASTGSAPEANSMLVPKQNSDLAMDAAACIGCGACVAACPNGSAALFTSAKISHLALLPQGQPERTDRVLNMVQTMDREGFGNCTMHRECEAVCPKEISTSFISKMNHEYLRATIAKRKENGSGGGAG
jgi:succinate dehydrogenase / fumarate reductase iron-sulfur subunit